MHFYSEGWEPYDQSTVFKDYIENRIKKEYSEKERNMEFKVNNKLETSYDKILNTVSYFSKTSFSKFPKSKTWNMEFWIDENNQIKNLEISCGIALKRPFKKTLYVKKKAKNLNSAIKKCIEVLENTVRRESQHWKLAS